MYQRPWQIKKKQMKKKMNYRTLGIKVNCQIIVILIKQVLLLFALLIFLIEQDNSALKIVMTMK